MKVGIIFFTLVSNATALFLAMYSKIQYLQPLLAFNRHTFVLLNIFLIVCFNFAKCCYFLVSYHSSFDRFLEDVLRRNNWTDRSLFIWNEWGFSFIPTNISSIAVVSLSKPTATHIGTLPKTYCPNTLSWRNLEREEKACKRQEIYSTRDLI